MDSKTEKALRLNARDLRMFARNGRWGTCTDCPRDSERQVYPEFCENTQREDHQLDMKGLAEAWEHSMHKDTIC